MPDPATRDALSCRGQVRLGAETCSGERCLEPCYLVVEEAIMLFDHLAKERQEREPIDVSRQREINSEVVALGSIEGEAVGSG